MRAPALTTAAALGLLLLAACASPPPQVRSTDKGRPAPASAGVPPAVPPAPSLQHDAAAALDWHPLVLAPFGTRFVDSPVRLHEVLLFREQSQKPAEIETQECYAVDGAVPAFAGRAPEEYLMCFEHDRLERIEATVRIEAEHAAGDFERACTLWSGGAQRVAANDACEGRDGGTAFGARLVVLPGETTAELHLTLSDPNGPAPAAP